MDESWQIIVGFELYEVSSLGQVRNAKTGRLKIPVMNRSGYLYVNLWKNGLFKTHKLHRLVAIHFIANPDGKSIVDHANRVRTDNRIENLRWTQ